jgi:hypothetical protein
MNKKIAKVLESVLTHFTDQEETSIELACRNEFIDESETNTFGETLSQTKQRLISEQKPIWKDVKLSQEDLPK